MSDRFTAKWLGLPFLAAPTNAGVTAVPALMAGGAHGMIAEGAISSAGQAAYPSVLGSFSSLSNILGIAGAALPGLMAGNIPQAALGTAGAAGGLAGGAALAPILGSFAGPAGLPIAALSGGVNL